MGLTDPLTTGCNHSIRTASNQNDIKSLGRGRRPTSTAAIFFATIPSPAQDAWQAGLFKTSDNKGFLWQR